MATTIVTKYGSDAPAASDLVRGELAVDTENGRLYTENSSGAVVEIGLNPEGNVNVTGTVSADGLTVANTSVVAGDFDGGTAATYIRLQDDTDNFLFGSNNSLGNFLIKNETADALRLSVANTGDISFYEDTGTTAKLFWDASAESLGIGTASPTGDLEIATSAADTGVDLILDGNKTSNGGIGSIIFNNNGDSVGMIRSNRASANDAADMLFYTQATGGANAERMRITSTGNVTVSGTVTATKLASANGVLELDDNGTHNGVINAPATLFINIDSDANSTGEDFIVGKDRIGTSGGTELFRVQENGNVGVGTSSPAQKFVVAEGTSQHGIELAPGTLSYIQAYDRATTDYGDLKIDAQTIQFGTDNGTERFRIASDGSLSTPTLGTSNVRFGVNAGNSIVSGGNYNTVVGDEAGTAITTGDNNTAVGYSAGAAITTGEKNVTIGFNSGKLIDTGIQNAAVGSYSLDANTTGDRNVAIGQSALGANTTADDNTAVGAAALAANTTGTSNAAVGKSALTANTTGIQNVAVGALAGDSITTGSRNQAFGYGSLESVTTADNNLGVGRSAGGGVTTGNTNTFVGAYNGSTGGAGQLMTTGSKNTILGAYNGNQNSLDIRTLSNHIVLSDGDGNPRGIFDSSGNLMVGGVTSSAKLSVDGGLSSGETIRADNSKASFAGVSIYSVLFGSGTNSSSCGHFQGYAEGAVRFLVQGNGAVYGNGTYGTYSDLKLKENIVDANSQWADIKAVQLKNYSMKEDGLSEANQLGVIAQDLEASGMQKLVEEIDDKDVDGNLLGTATKHVKYSVLHLKALGALQEAMDRIETLEAKVAALES